MKRDGTMTVFYTYPAFSSFVRNDAAVLRARFRVIEQRFSPRAKWQTPFVFLRQLGALVRHAPHTDVFVTWFSGYHAFLPGVIARAWRKPHLVILGGTDCVSFPAIDYGNYRRVLLGFFTRRSIEMATHLAPVHRSLVSAPYTYAPEGAPEQGYRRFVPGARAPYTEIAHGYDPAFFTPMGTRAPRSFLTLANLNDPTRFRLKGVDLVLEMARRFPDCTFTIAGTSGRERRHVDLPANVKVLPFVRYEDLEVLYGAHRFYFQLSMSEGFVSTLCEAMLCECVPIGSRVASIPECVGETGFLLAHRDADELEALVRRALASDAEDLGRKARARIIERWPPSTRQALADLVETLARGVPAPDAVRAGG